MNRIIKKVGICIIIAIILIVGIIFIIKNIKKTEIAKDKPKTITISIFDKDSNNIYKEDIETYNTYLIDVLMEKEDLKIIVEDSQYGKYITSIMGIRQGENYYWSYYIDGQYANVSVSECEIETNKHYSFRIEKFEY